jgi:NitT/TauT family transport system substrate-binding protein
MELPGTFARSLHRFAGWKPLALVVLAASAALLARHATAETIKVGIVRTQASAPIYIAQERGYFAAEGVPAELVYFDAGQPIAVATVAGSIDFGVTATTAGLYSLAGQGALRIIAASAREFQGFHAFGYLVSSRVYEAGVKSPKDLAGHSVALTQIGSPGHYSLGLLAEKYKFDLKAMRLLPLQSISNVVTAVTGGQADAMVQTAVPAVMPLIQKGEIRVAGWVGDETPWQFSAAFTATKSADQRADTVARFLRAYGRGVRDYHDAFTGSNETRRDGPGAPEILAIIAKYHGITIEEVRTNLSYFDRDARLDVQDVLHQIAWFKSQGMIKGEIDGDQVIDKRYVVPLPLR